MEKKNKDTHAPKEMVNVQGQDKDGLEKLDKYDLKDDKFALNKLGRGINYTSKISFEKDF